MATEELELREALSVVLTGRKKDFKIMNLERPVMVTPYQGAYGRAGVVIAINGSPPKALLVVTTDYGPDNAYVLVVRRPYRPGPTIELGPRMKMTEAKQRLYRAVIAYLRFVGIWPPCPEPEVITLEGTAPSHQGAGL